MSKKTLSLGLAITAALLGSSAYASTVSCDAKLRGKAIDRTQFSSEAVQGGWKLSYEDGEVKIAAKVSALNEVEIYLVDRVKDTAYQLDGALRALPMVTEEKLAGLGVPLSPARRAQILKHSRENITREASFFLSGHISNGSEREAAASAIRVSCTKTDPRS